QDDSDVLHGEPSEGALAQRLAYTLLDGRNELSRDGAADDLVDELESRSPLEHLDAQEHLSELPGPTRLLLVPAMALRSARDGLAIRDARGMRLHAHSITLAHPLEQHAQMEFAHPVQHGLIDGRMVLDAHARVFR